VTQLAEVKNRRGKRTRSAVSADTTSKSSDIKTIDVEEDGGDVQKTGATCSHRGQQRFRRPARRLGRKDCPRQAPAHWTTQQEVEKGPAQALQARP
jgi:hypothetical protein